MLFTLPILMSLRLICSPTNSLLVLQWILRGWNKTSFGRIESNLAAVVNQIATLEQSTSSSEELLSPQLRSLYNHHLALLRQLTLKWSSKARLMWSSFGDTNSQFFYKAATIHRRKNFIASIKTPAGEIFTDTSEIAAVFATISQDLWDKPSPSAGVFPPLPQISSSASLALLQVPSHVEILKALHSLPEGKAPGPDGLSRRIFSGYLEPPWLPCLLGHSTFLFI